MCNKVIAYERNTPFFRKDSNEKIAPDDLFDIPMGTYDILYMI